MTSPAADRPAHGVTLELAGLPGAGKTTLHRTARLLLEERGTSVGGTPVLPGDEAEAHLRRTAPRWWRRSRRMLERVVAARSAADPSLDVERFDRSHRRLWFDHLYAVTEAAHRPGVHLLEEGCVHELWRQLFYLEAAGDRRAVRRVQRWMPHAAVVVHVSAPTDASVRRIAGKAKLGPINRQLAAAGPAGRVWVDGAREYDRLLTRARRRARVVVLDNTADGALERNALALADLVQELAGPAGP